MACFYLTYFPTHPILRSERSQCQDQFFVLDLVSKFVTNMVGFSGGITSWAAAKRIAEREGTNGMALVFCDTRIEDPTLYDFVREAADNVGAPLHVIQDGRTPHQIFRDVKFMGNARIDPCSKHLKRDLLDAWRERNGSPQWTVYNVGLDWTEMHRVRKLRSRIAPWMARAPLASKPLLSKAQVIEWAKSEGLTPCNLYDEGFPHANCGGTCCKAGIAQWELLHRTHPDRFAEWEDNEQWMLENVSPNAYMLRDRRGGETTPLTLRMLRERIEKHDRENPCLPMLSADEAMDWGGCGCAVG